MKGFWAIDRKRRRDSGGGEVEEEEEIKDVVVRSILMLLSLLKTQRHGQTIKRKSQSPRHKESQDEFVSTMVYTSNQ